MNKNIKYLLESFIDDEDLFEEPEVEKFPEVNIDTSNSNSPDGWLKDFMRLLSYRYKTIDLTKIPHVTVCEYQWEVIIEFLYENNGFCNVFEFPSKNYDSWNIDLDYAFNHYTEIYGNELYHSNIKDTMYYSEETKDIDIPESDYVINHILDALEDFIQETNK